MNSEYTWLSPSSVTLLRSREERTTCAVSGCSVTGAGLPTCHVQPRDRQELTGGAGRDSEWVQVLAGGTKCPQLDGVAAA